MFMEEPWNTLPREHVGVAALRDRLQELLGLITDRAFPKLLSETRSLPPRRNVWRWARRDTRSESNRLT